MAQPHDAAALAQRIIEALAGPFDLDGHQVVVGASIGIAIAPTDGADPDQLLKNADMALYRAKADGRGTYRFFEPEMDARMQARRALEIDLRQALAERRVRAPLPAARQFARPADLRLRGAVRWNHPTRGTGTAAAIHSACRGDRADRADRRVGAAAGMRGGRKVARRHRGRRECLAGAIQEARPFARS